MTSRLVRTTVALPAELLAAADKAVRRGRARSRNELLGAALRHELAARERAAIDEAFSGMRDDPAYQDEALRIAEDFGVADWEAYRTTEGEP